MGFLPEVATNCESVCASQCCLPPRIKRGCALITTGSSRLWPRRRTRSLATLMPPLFQTVLERGGRGDVTAECRVAIVTLAFCAYRMALTAIAPAAAQWPQAARRTITLADRDDFAKHFLISAAIAAEAGSPLADAIGVYKEVDDSRRGSGFSFNDIVADRVGTRSAEMAASRPTARGSSRARSPLASRRVTSCRMSSTCRNSCRRRSSSTATGASAAREYNKMMATIEARVASRPLLR